MINVNIVAVSESIAVDARTNNVSLFNLLEQINVASFPAVLPKVVLFALFQREDGSRGENFESRVQVKLNEELLAEGPFVARFGKNTRFRGFGEFNSLVISRPGVLEFAVVLEGKKLGGWSISVESLSPTSLKQAVQIQEVEQELQQPSSGR